MKRFTAILSVLLLFYTGEQTKSSKRFLDSSKMTSEIWETMNHFECYEFADPSGLKTCMQMSWPVVEKLEIARNIAEIPIQISSGYRTVHHNKEVKGTENSAHVKGLAADIVIKSSRDRKIILDALIKVRFHRIGIYRNHIHVDLDYSKPQNIIYYGNNVEKCPFDHASVDSTNVLHSTETYCGSERSKNRENRIWSQIRLRAA